MPSINVSEDDFTTLATAANAAQRRGDREAAGELDKLARKVNAALANKDLSAHRRMGHGCVRGLRWTEVPSTLMGDSNAQG